MAMFEKKNNTKCDPFGCHDTRGELCRPVYCTPAPRVAALSDDVYLTSACLSRTSGLSREQRGLGRLKLAQR